ncbi:MAG TPA: hypothetical protein VEF76_06010 [Patescibacteria group bacterium]|nr:hypothetical protein [Patescibacteria group bacterium]
MKYFLGVLLVFLMTGTALAADFTVQPYPRNGQGASAEDWNAAMKDLGDLRAAAVVISKSWKDLEPGSRVYGDIEQLAKDFSDNAAAGRAVFFGFQPINTVRRELPRDLAAMAWNDAEMIARFKELVVKLAESGATPPKYVSLANEADVYFEKNPKEIGAFLKFYEQAQAILKQNGWSQSRIGITVTFDGLLKGRTAIADKLLQASEIAIFTYYPVIDLKPLPVENITEHLDLMQKAAGEKDIVLQEAGYPSSEGIGSSEARQAKFFDTLISAVRARDQFRMASLFALHDFSAAACDNYAAYYGFGKAPKATRRKFRDFLCTLGLKRADGTGKAAWQTVVKNLE